MQVIPRAVIQVWSSLLDYEMHQQCTTLGKGETVGIVMKEKDKVKRHGRLKVCFFP